MYKYSERGISKFFLIQLSDKQVEALASKEGMSGEGFKTTYLYRAEGFHIGIAEATYSHTAHSKPPEDGKFRKIRPAFSWLRLRDEFLHPNLHALNAKSINYSWVYATTEEKK